MHGCEAQLNSEARVGVQGEGGPPYFEENQVVEPEEAVLGGNDFGSSRPAGSWPSLPL